MLKTHLVNADICDEAWVRFSEIFETSHISSGIYCGKLVQGAGFGGIFEGFDGREGEYHLEVVIMGSVTAKMRGKQVITIGYKVNQELLPKYILVEQSRPRI